jgi:hypothetical protein
MSNKGGIKGLPSSRFLRAYPCPHLFFYMPPPIANTRGLQREALPIYLLRVNPMTTKWRLTALKENGESGNEESG